MADFQHQFSDGDIEVLIRYFEPGQAAASLSMTRLNAKRRRRPARNRPPNAAQNV